MNNFFIIIILFLSHVTMAQQYPDGIPEFDIFTLEGDSFHNEQLVKHTYTLFIYFNPTCGHCEITFTSLNSNAKKFKNIELTIYPISSNSAEKTKSFFDNIAPNIKELENVKILLDDDYIFADTFSVGGYPTSYLYDKDNQLIKVMDGSQDVLELIKDIK